MGAGEAVGVVVGDVVGVSLGIAVLEARVQPPHDLIQINLTLPRLFLLPSYIREPHLFCLAICGHVKTLFFNINSVSGETVSLQTVGAGVAVGDIVGDSVGDVVGACESVGDVVGDDVGGNVGAGEAVGDVDGDAVHPVHELIQMNLAFPRLLPLSS